MTQSEAEKAAREAIANLERECREREGLLLDYVHPKPFIQGFIKGAAWATERAAGILDEQAKIEYKNDCAMCGPYGPAPLEAQSASVHARLIRALTSGGAT